LRRGDGDRESRTGERDAERCGTGACAERVRLGDRVRDRSREMLRERDRVADRAGDRLREDISYGVLSCVAAMPNPARTRMRLLHRAGVVDASDEAATCEAHSKLGERRHVTMCQPINVTTDLTFPRPAPFLGQHQL
jgi:hypothetical protein